MAQPEALPRQEAKTLGLDRKWWILIAVGVGTFMSALDSSVANVILPVLRQYFNTDVASVEWVVTIYLLVVSGLLLSFGRLGDMRGHKQLYISGFVIFVIGSILCGFAPTVGLIIAFRALQAFGSAMLFSNSPAILTTNFPAEQRGRALGLQATMTYLGLTVGPSLGGWLTDQYSWRAVFFINVPVGLIGIALSMLFIPKESVTKSHEAFDLPGAIFFMAGLTLFLFALNQANDIGWNSPIIYALIFISLILLGIFVNIEKHSHSPLLDLNLFNNRLFSVATLSAFINYNCLYGIIFLMPFYLIQGRHLSPGQAGLILTAQPLVMAVTAPLSGILSDRFGSRILSTAGLVIMTVGLFLLSRLGAQTATEIILISLAVMGLGTGIFISPNTNALMGSAPKNRQGIASGVLAAARNCGMVLGVGIAGAAFTSIQSVRQAYGASDALFYAISFSFLISMGISAIGILISFSRGK